MLDFVHLHLHTEYSLLDGSGKISDIIERVRNLGMKGVAITDHGVMYGAVDFYKEAKEAGIKPIIGCELYVAPRTIKDKEPGIDNDLHHLVLLAKDEEGYKNLIRLSSIGFIEGFYYKPRIDKSILEKHTKGLIALSACLSGEIPKLLAKSRVEDAKKVAQYYYDIFNGNFYLELQDHGLTEQKYINKILIDISKDTGIPLVATNDAHYINKTDAKFHDILLCIQTGKTINEKDRLKFPNDEFYLKSPEEMFKIFGGVPEALTNTMKIAEECNFHFEFGKIFLPKYQLPDNITNIEYLRILCNDGLKRKYKNITKEIMDRLNYEIEMIYKMGYVDYFLIVWDFIRFAKNNGIMVGPGRGSAAGSLVAYCLDITNVDPIKYNLLFERFLNPERVSMPDIDIDFCYERRGEVIDYVVNKYGRDRVANIITFGTMAARAAVRDVGRALNMTYGEVDVIAKQIPFEMGMTIEKALELNYELKKVYLQNEKVRTLLDIAKSLEGLPRHASIHAAGIVIFDKPLYEYIPLQKSDDVVTTQFPMTTLEELGLLKMDFLGLRTLTVIRDTLDLVSKIHNIKIDLNEIDYNDKRVFNLIGQGETDGVFQLESSGMKQFMKELKPETFEDIIAGISLYRPGPMDQIPRYIYNKNNPDKIQYLHPKLEPILKVTYGCMVYQEQVMQIVRELAGYSLGRSDLVRRAMAKKKMDVMEKERKNFIYGIEDEKGNIITPGALRNGVDERTANIIFDEMMEFANYAFNKSHAAAYAVIAYQTAWLKTYYPVEFMASLLSSVTNNTDKVSLYIHVCKKMNIEVLPPDINQSYSGFTVIGNKIRLGLSAIKNVGDNAVKAIIKAREEKGLFKSLFDFCWKVDLNVVNKKTVESLIKSGAFDSLGITRAQALESYERIVDRVSQLKRKTIDGQLSLFEDLTMENEEDSFEIKELSKNLILSMEKEMLGFYISGHPLSAYEEDIRAYANITTRELKSISFDEHEVDNMELRVRDGDEVIIGGIVSSKSLKFTKNNQIMAFMTLEDLYGSIEVIIFPNVYEKYHALINVDNTVIVEGKISMKEEETPKIICNSVKPLIKSWGKICIELEGFGQIYILEKIKPILRYYKGDVPVIISLNRENKKIMADKKYWVKNDYRLIKALSQYLDKERINILPSEME